MYCGLHSEVRIVFIVYMKRFIIALHFNTSITVISMIVHTTVYYIYINYKHIIKCTEEFRLQGTYNLLTLLALTLFCFKFRLQLYVIHFIIID